MVWPIILAVVIALGIAILSRYVPDVVLDVVNAIAGIFLIGIFASTYANWDVISDLFSRFTWLMYLVGAVGGLMVGKFVKKFVPLPF